MLSMIGWYASMLPISFTDIMGRLRKSSFFITGTDSIGGNVIGMHAFPFSRTWVIETTVAGTPGNCVNLSIHDDPETRKTACLDSSALDEGRDGWIPARVAAGGVPMMCTGMEDHDRHGFKTGWFKEIMS
jgi:hypothetical protein